MSYPTHNNITLIENLPELDDLESYNGKHPNHPGVDNINNKFIRQHHQISKDAGMDPRNKHGNINNYPNISYDSNFKNNQEMQYYDNENNQVPYKENNLEKLEPNKLNTQTEPLSCISVAEHIANCPICSKFYNTDKTPYIITIIILVLICLILLKKVLDL